jgi:hypothetical protein
MIANGSSSDDFLPAFVESFARAMKSVDSRSPQAVNARSKEPFSPGIGPHTESRTVSLALNEIASQANSRYADFQLEVPYISSPRSRCDVCFGTAPTWSWSIEVKMLRLMGDNGKLNDNIVMHILSPYPAHRSAVTDAAKLLHSGLPGRKAVIIFAYEYDDWPAEPVIAAFELLASQHVRLGQRAEAFVDGFIHRVHRAARVFGWELSPRPMTIPAPETYPR